VAVGAVVIRLLFWALLIGVGYGVLGTLVAIAIGKAIKAGRGPEYAPEPTPEAAREPEPEDVDLDLLGDQPATVLTGDTLHDRFRQILEPEFTWEAWS